MTLSRADRFQPPEKRRNRDLYKNKEVRVGDALTGEAGDLAADDGGALLVLLFLIL